MQEEEVFGGPTVAEVGVAEAVNFVVGTEENALSIEKMGMQTINLHPDLEGGSGIPVKHAARVLSMKKFLKGGGNVALKPVVRQSQSLLRKTMGKVDLPFSDKQRYFLLATQGTKKKVEIPVGGAFSLQGVFLQEEAEEVQIHCL